MNTADRFDVAIFGAGIAGAGVAYFLSGDRRVLLLERESRPGMHTTGRSAAVYTQAYGGAAVRALTVASKLFYDAPPTGFADHPLLRPRGALFIGRDDQLAKLDAEAASAQRFAPSVRRINPDEAIALSPALRREYVAGGVYEPDAMDIDVDALLQGFLRGARAMGAELRLNAEVLDLAQRGDGWRIETTDGAVDAGIVVNAAGAWASRLARMAGAQPIEITPKRRTAFLVRPPEISGFETSPLTIDADEQFYFKPDAGLVLGSPADETPVEPQDIQPEELDIAYGADRIQKAANIPIRRIERSWAGLRCFAPDKSPVIGFDRDAPGFFWLAGQGGYGIQTAPAWSRTAAALLLGRPLDETLSAFNITAADLAPDRFY